jgi:osmoprotectant transport system permease protein
MGASRRQTNETLRSDIWRACDILRRDNNVGGVMQFTEHLAWLLFLRFRPTVVALVIYCQAILVRNVAAGIKGVDGAVLEAARGMGLSSRQILREVELPLAMPVILAGVCVAVLSMIAIATIAAFFNAGGLGALIREGISQDYGDKIATGVIAVALVAITCDQALLALARAARRG